MGHVDLSDYARHTVDLAMYDAGEAPDNEQFAALCSTLEAHGFELLPHDEAGRRALLFRNRYAPQLEYLIDTLCPRGFWAPQLGLELLDDVSA